MTGHCGATLVNATLGGMQSITGASSASLVAVEGKIFGGATEMLSGTVNGVVAGTLGANQSSTVPHAATGTGRGTQSLQSFSELAAPLTVGNQPGGVSSGTYFGNTVPRAK